MAADRLADAADRLEALAAEYWDAFLEVNPTFATAIGDRRFDDRLPDPTPEGAAASRARFAALLDRVDALGPDDGLPPAARITRSVLRESLASDVASLDTGLSAWNVDSLDGVPTSLLQLPEYQAVDSPEDGRRMVTRWRAMADHVDGYLATLRRGLSDGRVASTPPVERTIAILDGLLAEPVDRWPLLAPLARVGGGSAWTTADRERFAADLRAAVEDDIRPAFARLREGLATVILPAARPATSPGMGHVPGGQEAYRHLIRVHTSLDLAPEDLHRGGLEEIARIDAELASLAARTIGTRTLPEALAALRGDPALCFSTRDEVFAKAASSLARAEAVIPAWFGRLPRASCEVVAIGAYEEANSTTAYYRGPAADGSRPGQFYVNTWEPGTRPRYEAEALAYHEAVPGHHLQIAIAQELQGIADFRRHLGPTAFFEGWGLYTERLADEMGLYSGDLDRIGVLSYDAWRAARLVVDTGMHALGWTRDAAVEFMTEHTALAANNIANEIDRYIVLPGQALAYKTGQLEILRLRAAARDRLGPAFDIRGFHDAVLGEGAVPLATLRAMVGTWVEERVSGA
jgi:uncharacterized protein (DUF885 family)